MSLRASVAVGMFMAETTTTSQRDQHMTRLAFDEMAGVAHMT